MKKHAVKLSIFIIFFVFAALLNSVGILVERSQTVYGASKADASFLEPFKDVSIAVTAFFLGSFLPRLGYRRGLLCALGVSFSACLAMYFLNSFAAVRLLFLAVGVSFAVAKVSVYSLIGEISADQKSHSSLMSITESVFMLGIIAMYLIFPLFYNDADPNAWLGGFLFLAVLIAVAFIFISFSDINVKNQEVVTLPKMGGQMKSLLKSKLVIIFGCFAFLYVMTEQGIMSWLPTFNKDAVHLSAKLSAQMSVILMVSIAVGRFIGGILAKKIKWLYIAVISTVAAAAFVLAVLPLAKNIEPREIRTLADAPLVSFLFPMIGLFLAPLYPLVNSALLSGTPKNLQSSLAGIITFFSAIGGTTGSMIIGNLFENMGGDRVFYLSLIPLTALVGIFFLINKYTKNAV